MPCNPHVRSAPICCKKKSQVSHSLIQGLVDNNQRGQPSKERVRIDDERVGEIAYSGRMSAQRASFMASGAGIGAMMRRARIEGRAT